MTRDEAPFSLPSAAGSKEEDSVPSHKHATPLSPVLLDPPSSPCSSPQSPPSSPLAKSSPLKKQKKQPSSPTSPFREKSSFLRKFELEFDDSGDDDLFLSSDEDESSQRAKRKRDRSPSFSSRKKRKTDKEASEKSEEDGKIFLGADGEGRSISVPSHVGSVLFPHQVEGVKFLFENYKKGRGCVLGDDMGLGKTVQVIAFLSAICQKAMGSVFQSACEEKILIVVPASVIAQWEKELAKFGLNTFKVSLYHGQTKRMALSKIKSGYADVMISSYGMVQREIEEVNSVEWTCAIFDEVHKLKDRNSKVCRACCQLACQKRYGLTGTMMQNNFEELWCLLDWASMFFFFLFFSLFFLFHFLFFSFLSFFHFLSSPFSFQGLGLLESSKTFGEILLT